ncbi:MAG: hypothetical protein K6C40_15720 [Thermoguttaceae bacterium]|nr:hypothetical protein [Thermoguttaceae bacterium]
MKRAISIILLGSFLLTGGCTSLHGNMKGAKHGEKAASSSEIKSETASMRKTIDESSAGKERKKSNGSFLYGGLSSEAREIEDHLYGN